MQRKITCASGRDEAFRAFQRAIFEFEPEEPLLVDWAGKSKLQRVPPGKSERLVIRRVADEQNGAMPRRHGAEQSVPHQAAAKPARAIGLGDREGPE